MPASKQHNILCGLFCSLFALGSLLGLWMWILFSLLLPFAWKKLSLGCAPPRPVLTDGGVSLVCLVEVISCLASADVPKSAVQVIPLLLSALFWFFMRQCVRGGNGWTLLERVALVLALVMSLSTFATWVSFYRHFAQFEEASMTNFKQNFIPLGFGINDWGTFLLCLLPFPAHRCFVAFSKEERWVSALIGGLLVAALLLCLSRGILLSLAVCFVCCVVLVALEKGTCSERKRFFCWGSGMVVIGCIIALCVAHSPLLSTLRMSESLSQRRSLEGRGIFVKNCLVLSQTHPLLGAGAGNFSLSYDLSPLDKPSASLRPTNAYALILVEKGIAGLVCYVLLPLLAFVEACRRCRRKGGCIAQSMFPATLAALCVRGVSFSSIFYFRFVLFFSLLVLFATVQDLEERTLPAKASVRRVHWFWEKKVALAAVLGIWLLAVPAGRAAWAGQCNRWALRYAREDAPKHQRNRALVQCERAMRMHPQCVVYPLNWALLRIADDEDTILLENVSSGRATSMPEDVVEALERAASCSPSEPLLALNLALCRLLEARPMEAAQCLAMPAKMSHSWNPIRLCYGIALERCDLVDTARMVYAQALATSPLTVWTPFWKDLERRNPFLAAAARRDAWRQVQKHAQAGDPFSLSTWGQCLWLDGEHATAKRTLHEALRQLPSLNRPWLCLGFLAWEEQDSTYALECIEHAVRLDDWDALALLCRAKARGDKNIPSQKEIESLCARLPSHRFWRRMGEPPYATPVLVPGFAAYCSLPILPKNLF